jgi:hypothetical protein
VIYLQEARTVLSNAKEVNKCHHCNGHKHMAVQTSTNSSDFCQMMGSDSTVQHLDTSQQSLSYNHDGAEGWERVARESDLQQKMCTLIIL